MNNSIIVPERKGLFPTKVKRDFIVLTEEALEDVLSIDSIRAYGPQLYITVVGKDQFEEEKSFLKIAFSRGMFNILDYISLNKYAKGFTAFMKYGNELKKCFDKIEEDVKKEYLPFKYSVYLGIDLKKIARYKFNR